ncbi:HPr(Ser) kinase/phosphatase [Lachnoanaerobaculum saburreum DSM 3986]|uniref:HPr kinase/phosphorylase n=2 Tax=Lachnoanaerobaculum saburreum TaxID=467210 RepID=E6LKV5_9FIRM|nr:HPr(Ser) kinase/phosphatase [Lachnoanaerobaculum saburreum DSM 3986]
MTGGAVIGGKMGENVSIKELINELKLKDFTPGIDTESIIIKHPEINRPALQLAGFFDHFDSERVQVLGNVENAYIQTIDESTKKKTYDKLLSYKVPCVLYARGIEPDEDMLSYCLHYGVPCLGTEQSTTYLTAELIRWLNVKLAPVISIHGVLVDVYGEGVLITGDSGIGKSEAALELVKRGHRLVSDDVVEIRKVSQQTLVGTAPDITKHFIELRGIGIIDVKALFGVLSVKDTQSIDLVIQLEDWVQNKDYDRLGLEDNYIEYLGNKVVCHVLPVRPGRNLAIIVETAAVNHRQKMMGYNAAQELYNRVQANIAGKD